MGFGKFLKDKLDERKEKKLNRERVSIQIQDDIRNKRFCRSCHQPGIYNNVCGVCKTNTICDNCIKFAYSGDKKICRQHWSEYACIFQECDNLVDFPCSSCERNTCADHFSNFFNTKENVVYVCPRHTSGFVCVGCVDVGHEGTFRKHNFCPRCREEGYKQELSPDPHFSAKYR